MRLLEADLTSLSLAASKATGGVFGGMFSTTSGPLDPDVVHAAETALVALKGQHRSITSDPNFTKASDVREKAFVAALSACDSKHAHVVLCGLQYAHGLVLTTTVSVGNLTALAECMGKQTETTAGDDNSARDALVRRAQMLGILDALGWPLRVEITTQSAMLYRGSRAITSSLRQANF